jgi:hypothetical protein
MERYLILRQWAIKEENKEGFYDTGTGQRKMGYQRIMTNPMANSTTYSPRNVRFYLPTSGGWASDALAVKLT